MNEPLNIRNVLGLEQGKTEKKAAPIQVIKPRYIKLEQERNDFEKMSRNLKEQAEQIRASERLRIEINKGIKNGSNLESILLMALECIGLMTKSRTFYEENMKALNKGD